jgi:hypothetical protein
MRRLSHASGVVGVLTWVFLYLTFEVAPIGFPETEGDFFAVIVSSVVGGAIFYGLFYGAMQFVNWVWAGFRE